MKVINDIQNLIVSNKVFMILGLTFFVGLILITYRHDEIPNNEISKETIASIEDNIASTRVLRKAVNASAEENSSLYHFKLKPVNSAVLSELLKENRISASN